MGTKEIGNAEKDATILADIRDLAAILAQAGLDEKRLRLRIDNGARHTEGRVGCALSGGAGIPYSDTVAKHFFRCPLAAGVAACGYSGFNIMVLYDRGSLMNLRKSAWCVFVSVLFAALTVCLAAGAAVITKRQSKACNGVVSARIAAGACWP